MNFETIQALFLTADKLSQIKKDIKAFITNPDNPWEQREWVWLNCPEEFMHEENWILHCSFSNGEKISWYDDFSIERYEKVICRDLVDRAGWEGYKSTRNPEKEWEVFKTYCINNGIQSFTFDW